MAARDLVAAPVLEEFAFRACMAPLLLLGVHPRLLRNLSSNDPHREIMCLRNANTDVVQRKTLLPLP